MSATTDKLVKDLKVGESISIGGNRYRIIYVQEYMPSARIREIGITYELDHRFSISKDDHIGYSTSFRLPNTLTLTVYL